jgi:DNA-directed RNA polymerase subunit beta
MYYASDIDKTGKRTYATQIIPYRGAWLEYETDINGVMYVRIDKNRKMPLTMFIRALGIESREDIFAMFGEDDHLLATLEKDESEALADRDHSTIGVEALKEIYKKLRPGEPAIEESARTLINNYFFDPKRYDIAPVGRFRFDKKMAIASRIANHRIAEDIVSPITGELLFEAGTVLTPDMALQVQYAAVNEVTLTMDNGDKVKVLGNNTIEPEHLLGFDLKDCGVNEKVRTAVMLEIMQECAGDVDAIKATVKAKHKRGVCILGNLRTDLRCNDSDTI